METVQNFIADIGPWVQWVAFVLLWIALIVGGAVLITGPHRPDTKIGRFIRRWKDTD